MREHYWAMFFANLVAMQEHPGFEGQGRSIAECAEMADEMMEELCRRFGERE